MLPFFAKLPPCLIGIEACNNSHYWARELSALGHDVKLMPAQYVKPYVKRGKNDAADAEAICEAVTRPTMRFVAVKSPEQQSLMMLHRVRLMLVVGAMAVIRYAERHGTKRPWLVELLAGRPAKVAAVALANKKARIVWAMMVSGERYREPMPATA